MGNLRSDSGLSGANMPDFVLWVIGVAGFLLCVVVALYGLILFAFVERFLRSLDCSLTRKLADLDAVDGDGAALPGGRGYIMQYPRSTKVFGSILTWLTFGLGMFVASGLFLVNLTGEELRLLAGAALCCGTAFVGYFATNIVRHWIEVDGIVTSVMLFLGVFVAVLLVMGTPKDAEWSLVVVAGLFCGMGWLALAAMNMVYRRTEVHLLEGAVEFHHPFLPSTRLAWTEIQAIQYKHDCAAFEMYAKGRNIRIPHNFTGLRRFHEFVERHAPALLIAGSIRNMLPPTGAQTPPLGV